MREILFKAKHKSKKNKDWVFGYVWDNNCGNTFIRRAFDLNGRIVVEDIEVDPKTVCQYTGLTDKNCVKMFDGDIIDFSNGCENKSFYRIYWSNDYCCYYICGKDGQKHDIIQDRMKNCIVIGNIHDKEE